MADMTEAEVIRDIAFQAAIPAALKPGEYYALRQRDGSLIFADHRGDLPSFKAGYVLVRDVASFKAYWDRHADEDSEVFASIDGATVTAILDAHRSAEDSGLDPDEQPRWQRHRLALALEPTPAWRAWLMFDRAMRPQVDWAEFLEDNYRDLAPRDSYPDDIAYVSPADFLELAQKFTATTRVEFESGQRLSNGETEIVFKETTTASAGKQRKISVPEQFCLAIAPYDDCSRALISARFRYRGQTGGPLTLGYFLDRPQRVAEDAVREIAALVSDATGRDVMLGAPS